MKFQFLISTEKYHIAEVASFVSYLVTRYIARTTANKGNNVTEPFS